ncbi:alpha/beta hydrolase [Sphingobacteriales bacterium UPWRP_1]|nr:hypothetical protein BVG80_18485 [Sphingobacteriales bacterium TSM_CSM]PSJ73379.1 alpha/beta hydrolase [Sphingobacteriales bacterium UPWRP_1]
MASIQSIVLRGSMHIAKGVVIVGRQHKNVSRMRHSFERITHRLPMPPQVHFSPFFAGNTEASWFLPQVADPHKVILFLHGGGYATGSINTAKSLIAKIALETGIKAIAINYRLAPEHPFPAALQDSVAIYEYLLNQGYLPQNICIAGSSAGGGLALSTLQALKINNTALPAVAVCLSPWTDLAGTGKSVKNNARKDPMLIAKLIPEWATQYAGKETLFNPLISPLYGNAAGLPPTLLQVGTHEILLDDSVRYAEMARNHGVDVTLEVWQNMIHGWQLHWGLLPEANRAIGNIARFIHRHMHVNPLLSAKNTDTI